MSAVLSGALEHELKGLEEEIVRVSQSAQAKRDAADNMVADYRKAGVNPLIDDDAAAKVEAAFLAADEDVHRKNNLEIRRNTALERFASISKMPTVTSADLDAKRSSLMDAIINVPGFEALARASYGEGRIGELEVGRLKSRDETVAGIKAGNIFAAGADGASLIPIDQRLVPPLEILTRQLRLIDLITVGATDSDLVRYGKQTVRTSAAASSAVGTAGVGVAYNQATYTWSNADVAVRSIGHYAKAPRENLADQAALQTLIEGQLSEDVLLQAESLIYSGGGTGQDFSGIKTEALTANAYITRDETNEPRVSSLHRALTAVRLAYVEPDAIWIHPTDYHNAVVERWSSTGGFLLDAAAAANTQPTLWGVPVVQSALATLGEPTVGAFKRGATLWLREGVSVRISDSNEDDFIKRMIAILAEFRGAFAVQRPAAFCRIKNFT